MPRKQKQTAPLPGAQIPVSIPVFCAAAETGLSDAQVAERVAAGLDNRPVEPPRKTAGQIVKENVFTYFNMLFFLLALCIAAVGQWLNLTFMGVVLCNTVIGTIQEPMTALVPGAFSIFEPNMQFSFTYTENDVKIYLEMVAQGKLHFPNMVTDIASLDECVEKVFAGNRRGQIKVLIDPSL